MSKVHAVVLAFCCFGPSLAMAVPVPIVNPSFEANLSVGGNPSTAVGWTVTGAGGGTWDYSPFGTTYFDVAPPDGNQVGFLSIGPEPGGPATMEQTVGVVQSNTIYTLTGYFGHPKTGTWGVGTDFTYELVANGVDVLATATDNGPTGTFDPFTLTFSSVDSPFVGAPLSIRLMSSKAQTEFDLISLDATPLPAPEPASFWLLGLGLIGMARRVRSKNVLRTASQAFSPASSSVAG